MALLIAALLVGCGQGSLAPGASPSASPASSPVPAAPTGIDARPPAGLLSASGEQVTGYLGTYCWQGTCADVFDLPARADLPQLSTSGDDLGFGLESDAGFLSWSASYGAEAGADMMPLGEGGSDHDPDTAATVPPRLTMATIEAPPAGEWVVIIQTTFENGDAQYAWHVTVE